MRVVLALGGNALLMKGQKGTFDEQMENARKTAKLLSDILCSDKYKLAVTHGNGPQVGNLLIQNELAKGVVEPMPLHVLNAETQAIIGYMLQNAFREELFKRGCSRNVVTIITQVLVDRNDPAFESPTKFVGPFYTEEEAKELMKKGLLLRRDPRGGWRRVVPSPEPKDIIEKDIIRKLYEEGVIVIATGGGGIPVTMVNGRLVGVDAVIDKDLASALLGKILRADLMIILTDVDYVMLNFGKPNQEIIELITLSEIKRYYEDGQFPPGSMGPKIKAALVFLESGGKEVRIGSLMNAGNVIKGEQCTRIVPD